MDRAAAAGSDPNTWSDQLTELAEDFRLFCMSYWAQLYTWVHALLPSNVAAAAVNSIARMGFYTQLFLALVAAVLLFGLALRLYMWATSGVCTSTARLDGRTVIVTGANSGIGLETSLDLAGRGARVILACRSVDKGEQAAAEIKSRTGNGNVVVRKLDLSSMDDVRRCARDLIDTEERLDVLVLNAGVALTQKYSTEDGLELHMASNHFGHFLLTLLLVPMMASTAASAASTATSKDGGRNARVVVVSSVAHKYASLSMDNLNAEREYNARTIYGATKLANVLFTKELSRRLKLNKMRVTANCLHPGAVQTALFRNIPVVGALIHFLMGLLFKSAKEGAQTSIFLSVDPSVESVSGEYFSDCRIDNCSKEASDPNVAKALWIKSAEIVQLGSSQDL